MFESTVLRQSPESGNITAGLIAESLLYYQNVHLILGAGALITLLRQIGPRQVLELVQRPEIKAVFHDEILGIATNTHSGIEFYDFHTLAFIGTQEGIAFKNPEDHLRFDLERAGFDSGIAKSFAKRFFRYVPVKSLSGNHFFPGGVGAAVQTEIDSPDFFVPAVRAVLRTVANGYVLAEDTQLDLHKTSQGYCIFGNLDLGAINKQANKKPQEGQLTTASILNLIYQAVADMMMASFYSGDYVTSQLSSELARIRHSTLFRRSDINKHQQAQFSEIILPDLPSVAATIDSGDRSLSDFLKILRKSNKFKAWLKTASPDEGIVREYIVAQSRQNWGQSLPTKLAKYILTSAIDSVTALGPFGPAGLADTLLGDRLTNGWRPNHFIDTRLKPFLRGY